MRASYALSLVLLMGSAQADPLVNTVNGITGLLSGTVGSLTGAAGGVGAGPVAGLPPLPPVEPSAPPFSTGRILDMAIRSVPAKWRMATWATCASAAIASATRR